MLRRLPLTGTLYLLFALSMVSTCLAQALALPSIPGLTRDLYFGLSGVWDENPSAGTYESSDEGLFSWGKSRYDDLGTVIIDLGGEKPYIQQYTTKVEVLSITGLSSVRTRIDCKVVGGPVRAAKSGYLVLTLSDGVLRFEEHFPSPQAAFNLITVRGMRRIDGPSESDGEAK